MKKVFLIILLSLALFACRKKSVEIARYELTQNEINLFPYEYGDHINFIHTNGYSFDFTITQADLKWEKSFSFCEWSCNVDEYISYQVNYYEMKSTYPNFNIEIVVGADVNRNYLPQTLNISINKDHNIQFTYDSLANYICDSVTEITHYDSISLNNKFFYNVYSKDFSNHELIRDSSEIFPQSLYVSDLGILQIKMSNNETYTLND